MWASLILGLLQIAEPLFEQWIQQWLQAKLNAKAATVSAGFGATVDRPVAQVALLQAVRADTWVFQFAKRDAIDALIKKVQGV